MAVIAERPTVVTLRALFLGDLLTAVPALLGLSRAYPEHRRVLCLPRSLHPLVAALGLAHEVSDARPLGPVDPRLRQPAVAVNLHGRGPRSHHRLAALEPGRMLAFRHSACPRSLDGPIWREDEHERARLCRLLDHYGLVGDPSEVDVRPPVRSAPRCARHATVVHPGAASSARRWPAERYAAVARREAESGRSVVVTGSTTEVELARVVARRAGLDDEAVLAGRTDVVDLAAIVAVADRVVCGDTGVAHLATALRTPSVVLFGPTPPTWWGPPEDRPWHKVLWAGRTGDPHGASPDPGLLEIGVIDVIGALDALPPRPAALIRRSRRAPAGRGRVQPGAEPAPTGAR